MRKGAAVMRLMLIFGIAFGADAEEAGPPVLLNESTVSLPVGADALRRQYERLASMPAVEVEYSSTGAVKRLTGNTNIFLSSTARALKPGESGKPILDQLKDILLAGGGETLTVRLNDPNGRGSRNIHLDQSIRGIPVLRGGIVIDVNEATGKVEDLGAIFLPDRGLPQRPKLSASEASQLAIKFVQRKQEGTGKSIQGAPGVGITPTLAYFPGFLSSTGVHLVWVVEVSFIDVDAGPNLEAVWIDALDGSYVAGEALLHTVLSRAVYTASPTRWLWAARRMS